MSTLRLSLAIAVLVVIGAPARLAQAQVVSGLDNGQHPFLFIEPDTFRPDFQFFAPADATNYETGRDRDPNRGFFFTFERMYISVTRPETRLPVFPPSTAPPGDPYAQDRFSYVQLNPSFWEGDFTWGNRVELGFIDCDDKGWSIVGWHIDGPNRESEIVNGDRLGGPQTGADPDPADPQNIGVGQTPNPLWPYPPAATTDLPVYTSVNTAKMSSFELMRIFERQYFHNGAVLEPMAGFRYIKFDDRFNYAYYQRSNTDPALVDAADDLEFYRVERAMIENNMVGGQLGFRLFKQTGHWNLSTEFRMFALQNFQNYSNTVDNYIFTVSGSKVLPARSPDYNRQERLIFHDRGNEFCWGGEVKVDAAYQLTRDISFRNGFVFLDLGQGVGRGRDLATNNQDVQMFGYTFGIDIKR
jgi:hypothetical protein